MNDHDPQHGTARWLVAGLCAAGLLLAGSFAVMKIAGQRQLARFQQITPSMNTWDIERLCGKPARTWGSGILRYEYDIWGGGTVTITFHGLQPGLIAYDGEVLFERQYPPPVSHYTHSIPAKPSLPSPEALKTLQSNPPPKRNVPEP